MNASEQLRGMTLEQKVGQIFILTWKSQREAENNLALHPGGFIRIYSDVMTVARESFEMQRQSAIPLIIAADLERGIGGTIGGALEVVTAMAIGATGSTEAAYTAGNLIGKEAAAFGINMNYAPVLDVNSNALNPVINTRSFGQDPHLVARLGVAFSRGLRAAGVLSCGKHFPGHGDSSFDSHANLGSVTASQEQLDAVELLPFREAIASGIDAIMSAHLIAPSLDSDPVPATLSRKIMTGLLREKLGFKGVAVTDALDMGAIARNFPPEVSIPQTINAGCDQLIMPNDAPAAYDILLRAVRRGDVTEDRLNEAVVRILDMKARITAKPAELTELGKYVSVSEYVKQANAIAAKAITLVDDSAGVVPLKKSEKHFCLVFSNGSEGRSGFLEPVSFPHHMASDGWKVSAVNVGSEISSASCDLDAAMNLAESADVILLAAYISIRLSSGTIALDAATRQNLEPFFKLGKPVVLLSFGSPYVGQQLTDATAFLCGYGATQPTQNAMADCLKGVRPITGKLPVRV